MEMLMEIVLLQQTVTIGRANQSNCIKARTNVFLQWQQTEQPLLQDQTDSNHINGLAPAAPYGPGTYTVVATAGNVLMEIVPLQQCND
jgi:hypothetical protein